MKKYEYDYHELAEDADYIEEDYFNLTHEWENYYHNIMQEIED
jgi:hypothetical protein